MKQTLSILFFLLISVSYSQEYNSKVDSLKNQLLQSNGTQWIDVAIELSSYLGSEDINYSNTLIDDAIELSKNLDYKKGLGRAYLVKGELSYNIDKTITGVTYYGKSTDIFIDEDLHSLASDALIGMAEGFIRMYRNDLVKDTLMFALQQFSDSISPESKSELYYLLGESYRSEGRNNEAIDAIHKGIYVQKEHNLTEDLTESYNSLGIIYSEIGKNKEAIEYYDLSYTTAKKNFDTINMAGAIHNKAIIFFDWGLFDEALSQLLDSKELLQMIHRDDELAASFSTIAVVYHEIGNLLTAKEYYNKTIELADTYGDMGSKFIAMHNIGELLYEEKKYDSSLLFLNKALRYEMEQNNPMGIAESKSMIATLYVAIEKYSMAFTYFNEAEEVFTKFDNKRGLANLYIEYAKAHQKLRNDSLSISFYEKGINLANILNDRKLALGAYRDASENYERLGMHEKAFAFFKNYKNLIDSVFDKSSRSRIQYMSLKLENQQRDQDLISLESQQKMMKLESRNKSFLYFTAIIFLIIVAFFFSWRFNIKKKSEANLTKQYRALLETEQKVKALLDSSFDSTLLVDTNGVILTANNNNLNGFFDDLDSLINKNILLFFTPVNQKVINRFLELVLISNSPKDIHIQERNNTQLNIKISPVNDLSNNVKSLAFYIKDITQIEKDKEEKKKMESQLVQTQKMETVGTLAGGIAHDFNNYLATISGYISMSLEDVDKSSHVHKYLANTKKAVVLAQGTVKKLLAFSRSNDIIFDKVLISELLKDSNDMLKGSKPKNIQLLEANPNGHSNSEILADKNQLTQVIINIGTNAFHAIDENKGIVKFETFVTKAHPSFLNKEMICIQIKDNGIGMEAETQKRIFEPFYTTKEVGKGTGLGLSVVSGIINQHKGKIEVESEFGEGTTFSIFLPII